MKKKLLAVLLVLVMLVGIMPVTALADSAYLWKAGDIFTSEDPNAVLPELEDENLAWEGPSVTAACGSAVHEHEYECYPLTCGGTNLFHWWHDSSCYDTDAAPICGKEEHTHDADCYIYQWVVVDLSQNESSDQYRNWWPLYWGFDRNSSREANSSHVSVQAGGMAVKYTAEDVTPRNALADNTANVGGALRGVTMNFEPGYYLTGYRFVCGNHDDCGVNPYRDLKSVSHEGSSYTIYPDVEEDFDHWDAIGGLKSTPGGGSGFYCPLTKPDPNSNNLYAYSGSNTIYPFYLLLEVDYSPVVYDVTYNYGDLANLLSAYPVPGPDELLHNESCDVRDIPAAAEAAANAAGYVFGGWMVSGDGYNNDVVVYGDEVTCYGSDLVLTAIWTNAPTVSYEYEGDVPANAPELPETETVTPGDEVTVAADPTAPEGYTFTGWYSDDPNVGTEDTTFTMPTNSVVLKGRFEKNSAATKELTYYIEYYKNDITTGGYVFDAAVTKAQTGSETGAVTTSVWVNDTTAPLDTAKINTTDAFGEDYEFVYTDPLGLPAVVSAGDVIKIFYNGTNDDAWRLTKEVSRDGKTFAGSVTGVEVGDTLTYQVTVKFTGNDWDATNTAPVEIHDRSNAATPHVVLSQQDIDRGISSKCNEDNGEDIISIPRTLFTANNDYSVTVTYTSKVDEDDAGNTILNGVWDKKNTVSDTTTAEVLDQYTLTVEYYLDGVKDDVFTYDLNAGDGYSVFVGTGDATHVAPKTIMSDGINYVFEGSEGDLNANGVQSDVVVKLYYATDMIGPDTDGDGLNDDPDKIPDKYQIRVAWAATEGGTLTIPAGTVDNYSVVYTLKDDSGKWVTSLQALTITPESTVATPDAGYSFTKWTYQQIGHHETEIADKPAAFGSYDLANVSGGDVYIFRAYFHANDPRVELHKYSNETGSVEVGDYIHYYVSVTNTGNVDLKALKITDTFSEDIEDLDFYAHEGVEYDTETGVITVVELPVGQTITLHFGYEVQPENAGKQITNKVVAEGVPEDDEDNNDTEITVKTAADLSAVKTLTSIGNWTADSQTEQPVAVAGDKIVWTITVSNSGETDGKTALPADTLDGENLTVVPEAGLTADEDGLYTVPAEGSIRFTASYTVTMEDAGKTLTNVAVVDDKKVESDEDVTVANKVTVQYLTEELDGTTRVVNEKAAEFMVAAGGTWTIAFAEAEGVDHVAPETLTDSDKTYTYFTAAPALTGTMADADVVVKLTYAVDEIGPDEEPDEVPDKYQVTVVYTADANGEITSEPKSEVLTILDASGAYAASGSVTFTGASAQAKVPADYDFAGWQLNGADYEADADETLNSAELAVEGGKTYTFKATYVFDANPGLDVEKEVYLIDGQAAGTVPVAGVGDVVVWAISVTNTGNVPMEGVVVADKLQIGNRAVDLELYDGLTEEANVVETVDLDVGETVVLYASYTVTWQDAGKTLVNKVRAEYDDPDLPDGEDPADEDVNDDVKGKGANTPHKPNLNKKDHVAYIIGYTDETVRPSNNITRAEVATIFFRLLTDDSRAEFWSKTNPYTDVPADAWFNNAISTMSNAGIVTGYPDGTFRPNAPITRAEFAAIAARFSDVIYGGESGFSDVFQSHWAWDEIALAYHLGWINGYPDNTFRPDNYITRAESMTLINRVLERAVEEPHMLPDMITWIDNLPYMWYYEAVQEATNSHTYERTGKRVPDQSFYYEDWLRILPPPDWAALERSWSDANDQ